MANLFGGKILLTSTGEIRCNCCLDPTASFSCESEQISPELCGYSEFQNNGISPSVPPLSYKVLQKDASGGFNSKEQDCGGLDYFPTTSAWSNSITCTYNCLNNSISSAGEMIQTQTDRYCSGGEVISSTTTSTLSSGLNNCNKTGLAISKITSTIYSDTDPNDTRSVIGTLSSADTDSDAINRETTVDGTLCSSLWSTRDTGFSWVIRTSSYKIECADLINGLRYQVTPTIRRRTAVIGSEGSWSNITVSAITFTATSDTKSLPSVALGHIQGYEYQITGVTIEET